MAGCPAVRKEALRGAALPAAWWAPVEVLAAGPERESGTPLPQAPPAPGRGQLLACVTVGFPVLLCSDWKW